MNQRPNRLAASALPAASFALAGLLAACGLAPTTPTSPPEGGSVAGPPPTLEAAACPVQQPPGPRDTVPDPNGGDAIDTFDLGSGRWRLCLTEPAPIIVEGSAWCTWTDDRTFVTEVAGLPINLGPTSTVDGGISIERKVAYLSSNDGSAVASWEGGPIAIDVFADAGGGPSSKGSAAFRIPQTVDPEHPPAVRPPDAAGAIGWQCGDPPPFRPGRASGTIDFHVDSPVDRTWRLAAACDWVTTPAGPRLRNATTTPDDLLGDGQRVGVEVRADDARPYAAIWVDTGDAGGFYSGNGTEQVIVPRLAPNAGSGLLRLRKLRMDAESIRIAPGVDELSGTVGWTCPQPPVDGPTADAPEPEVAGQERHPGTVTLTFDPPVVDPVAGVATCTIRRDDPAYLSVSELRGTADADGRSIDVRSDGSQVLLVLLDPGGDPAGEYAGQIARFNDQADRPPLLTDVEHLPVRADRRAVRAARRARCHARGPVEDRLHLRPRGRRRLDPGRRA
jgi:hypothetical protein